MNNLSHSRLKIVHEAPDVVHKPSKYNNNNNISCCSYCFGIIDYRYSVQHGNCIFLTLRA